MHTTTISGVANIPFISGPTILAEFIENAALVTNLMRFRPSTFLVLSCPKSSNSIHLLLLT